MITREFLESRPDFSAAIPVPAETATPGYYPSSYGIRWDADAKEYRISLEGLVRR